MTSIDVLNGLTRWRTADFSPALWQEVHAVRSAPDWPPATPETTAVADDDEISTVDVTLRERAWQARTPNHVTDPPVVWHESVRTALVVTLREAESAGVRHANLTHLVVGVVSGLDVDRERVVMSLRADPSWRKDGDPLLPVVSWLKMTSEVDGENVGLVGFLGRLTRWDLKRGSRYGGTVAQFLLQEALRQAVLTDSAVTTTGHLVAAMASFDAQLDAAGHTLPSRLVPFNRGSASCVPAV